MTNQEALNSIIEDGIELGAGDYVEYDALILAKAALEKQIPKKPKHQGCYDGNSVWHEWNGINGRPYELCPNCETNLCCEMPSDRKPKFCDNCGQALDWGES